MAPLQRLLQNENLRQVIPLLSEDNEMYGVIREEIRILAEDEETRAFIQQNAEAAADLLRQLKGGGEQPAPEGENQVNNEEAAP